MQFQSPSLKKEGAALWILKVLSGVLIIVILGVHLVINHLVAPGGLLTYSDILAYYQNPIIPIMEIAFIVLVVPHCLLGIRSVLVDLDPKPQVLKIIDRILQVLGLATIVYGVWLILLLVSRGS